MYKFIHDYALKTHDVNELTVEDPNEAFDDLRDVCDLAFLQENFKDDPMSLKTPDQLVQYKFR